MLYIFVIRNLSPEKSLLHKIKHLSQFFPPTWTSALVSTNCVKRVRCAVVLQDIVLSFTIIFGGLSKCARFCLKNTILATIAMANTILQIGLFCFCSMWSNWGILHCFEADVCRAKEKTRVPPTPPWRRPYGDQQRRPPGETRRLWWGKVRSAAEWNDTHCRYVSMQRNPSLDRVVSQNHQV